MAALTSSEPLTQLPISFRTYTFHENTQRPRVLVSGQVKKEAVSFSSFEPLKVMGVAYARDGSVASLFSDSLKIAQGDEEISFRSYMRVAPGNYRLKLAVVDPAGMRGTAEKDLIVPAFRADELMSSSMVISQRLERFPLSVLDLQAKLSNESDPVFHNGFHVLAPAENVVEIGSPVAVFYKVHNLEGDPSKRR